MMRLPTSKPNRLRATCTAVGSALAMLLMSHAAALAQAALPTETIGTAGGDSNWTYYTARVDTPGVVPPYMSGIVTWRDEKGKVLARAILTDNNGHSAFAQAQVTGAPPSGDTVQVIYSGDCTYAGSAFTAQVGARRAAKGRNLAGTRGRNDPAIGTALTASSGYWDQPTTLAALVMGLAPPVHDGPPVTGVVTFFDGADILGGAPVGADGNARLTVQPKRLAIGANRVRATFNGTGQYAGQTSSACGSIVMFPPAGR